MVKVNNTDALVDDLMNRPPPGARPTKPTNGEHEGKASHGKDEEKPIDPIRQ